MASRRVPLWRSFLSWLFLLLFCLAAPVALVTGWARLLASDPEAYAQTVSAAADDPRVQEAIAGAVTQKTVAALGGENPTAGEAVLQRLLVEEVSEATRAVLASPEFAEVWEGANRAAYAYLLSELSAGWGQPVDLDLSPLAGPIQAELDAIDVDLPVAVTVTPDDLQIEILDGQTADQLRRASRQLVTVSWGSLAVAIVSLILAVALSGDRPRAIARAGFGLAIAMAVLMALLLVGEQIAAKAAGDGGGDVALIAVTDAVSQGLRVSAIGLALGGLLLAGVFTGVSALTRSIRRDIGA